MRDSDNLKGGLTAPCPWGNSQLWSLSTFNAVLQSLV